jgi:CRISPR/Cas system-associated protein endoribonuclease Cas2
MFLHASTVGNQTQIKQRKTATGIKDTFLESFLNHLAESYSKICGGNRAKQEALDRAKETLPENVTSPVWRIKGL